MTKDIEKIITKVLLNRIKNIGEEDQTYTGYPQQLIDELVSALSPQEETHD